MDCPFCQSYSRRSTVYPKISFNKKDFEYRKCNDCGLEYLDPLPDEGDYQAMYPPAYQGGETDGTILRDWYKKMPGLRFAYGYQLDLVKKYTDGDIKILDYGCGNGHFIANAHHHGYICDGSEFSPEYISILKNEFPLGNFYTIDEVLADGFGIKYDVIRLSNVLEHLTEPGPVIRELAKKLNTGGIFLIEGPVEANFSVASSFRKLYFFAKRIIRPGRTVSAPPYHIFFSDRRNQRNFFRQCGLSDLHFEVKEDAWPFPASIKSANGISGKCMAAVASISKAFSALSGGKWGNMFVYCGRKEKE